MERCSTGHQEVTTICMKVYTTPMPTSRDLYVLQHTQGRPAATLMGWLGDVRRAGVAIQNLSLL